MANNIHYAEHFLKENLRKGYSVHSLTKLLKKKRVDQDLIKKALSSISPTDYEDEAIDYLSDLLRRNMEKGVKTSTVMSMLEEKGIDHRLITKALENLKGKKQIRTDRFDANRLRPVLIVIGVILILAVLWFLIMSLIPDKVGKDCGTDKNCFHDLADSCLESTVIEALGGSTLQYQSFQDCTIIKQFIEFGPEEPAAVTRFFTGKQMVCKYKKNTLRKEMTTSLVGSIESCTGLLKDAVYELEYARIQLES